MFELYNWNMKSLKPTMREKKRYVLYEMPGVSSGAKAKEVILSSIKDYLGELGLTKTCIEFILFDSKQRKGIFAINREAVDPVRASLVLSKEHILVKKVSGIIARCKREL